MKKTLFSDMQEQLQLHKELREKQEKYAYYIIALCVTAIGFSVIRTSGQSLKLIQIPVALAVLCWAVSIYCGLNFISIITASIHRNIMYLDIIQGNDPDAGNDPLKIQIGTDVYHKGNPKLTRKSVRLAKFQERLFYLGIFCFIAWHLLQMYFANTK